MLRELHPILLNKTHLDRRPGVRIRRHDARLRNSERYFDRRAGRGAPDLRRWGIAVPDPGVGVGVWTGDLGATDVVGIRFVVERRVVVRAPAFAVGVLSVIFSDKGDQIIFLLRSVVFFGAGGVPRAGQERVSVLGGKGS